MAKFKIVVCERCKRERPHHAKGLCHACYATLIHNPNAKVMPRHHGIKETSGG